MLEKIRTVKSPEEIAILDKAAALGDLMLQACRDTARPGVRECEVYARMMEAMVANGGEEPTLFLWAADKHPYPHPFRVPTMRPLEKGDMIICEMHPKFGGYFTHVERTFCLGKPEARYLDIYDACLAAYRRGLGLFRPGGKISEAMDAVRDTIEEAAASAKPASAAMASRRWNIALSPPRIARRRGRAQAHWRRVPCGHGVRHEHRSVRSQWHNGETGCVFAETIVITDDGARRMHSFSTDFQELPIWPVLANARIGGGCGVNRLREP